jgi:hypothetical protein
VSIFLNEGIQDQGSQFILRKPQTKGSTPPGTVRVIGHGDSQVDLAFEHESPNEWFCHPMKHGENLFRFDPVHL